MVPSALPPGVGVGFKPRHFADIDAAPQPVAFFEVHAENYMGEGGPPHAQLEALRRRYEISVHGVGLSIGGEGPLDRAHLARLRALCDRYEPKAFSEHLAWSSHGGVFLNDLLPLPYTEATLARVADHVDRVQEAIGRRMLLENPATYLAFAESTIPEAAFLRDVCRRTGCGLLLDVANLVVSVANHGTDPEAYLAALPLDRIGEMHLAGHEVAADEDGTALLIDTHGSRVPPVVWALYGRVVELTGPIATLVEWDNNVPEWPVLLAEATAAASVLRRRVRRRTA